MELRCSGSVVRNFDGTGVVSGSVLRTLDGTGVVSGSVLRTLDGTNVISGSSQVNAEDSITNFDTNVKTKLDNDGVLLVVLLYELLMVLMLYRVQ